MKRDIENFSGLAAAAENGNVSWLVSDVRVIPAEAIQQLVKDGPKITNVVLKAGFDWQLLTARDGTASYSVSLQLTEHGPLYENVIVMETIKLLPAALDWLQRFSEVPVLFLVEEINGFTRLVGLPHEPLVLGGSGGSASFIWQYAGMTTSPGHVVTEVVSSYYEFSTEFSTEFNS
jgi:hypothetical protein